ncbi:hypothetical protein LP417_34175 (plasmid) [Polaromonas sp. P1-6]|nr:hypothetical protein LP417_34175 [Polaromonas sp. P1-6]
MPDQPPIISNSSKTRRENLYRLLREFTEQQLAQGVPAKGIEQAFAARVEMSPSTLSQLKSSRNISDKVAAQMEKHAGKALGWMDTPQGDQSVTPAEAAFIELARAAWRMTDAKGRRTLLRLAKDGFGDTLNA